MKSPRAPGHGRNGGEGHAESGLPLNTTNASAPNKWAWLRAVIRAEGRTVGTLATAALLADFYNAAKAAAWPAERTLANEARLDRRNVRRAIAWLIEHGFLTIAEPGGPRRSARYAIALPANTAGSWQSDADCVGSDADCVGSAAVARGQPQRSPRSNRSGRPGTPAAVAPERPEPLLIPKGHRRDQEGGASARGGSAGAAPPRARAPRSRKPMVTF